MHPARQDISRPCGQRRDRLFARMGRLSNTRVFISYARSDGLAFARRLRTWLEEKDIPLFQDLVSLVGGDDFLLQIYKAIDQTEFLVMLMTPCAVASRQRPEGMALRTPTWSVCLSAAATGH